MRSIFGALLTGAFLLVAPVAANAVVVISSTDAVTISNYGPVPVLDATTGTVFQNVTTSIAGVRRSPYEGTALDGVAPFSSISGGATGTYNNFGTANGLSFLWGSPDSYNLLQFYLLGALQGSFSSGDVVPPGTVGLGFVNVVFSGLFDEIRLSSDQNAFEYAMTDPQPVPVPGALPLFAGGLGLMGLLAARRRRKHTTEALSA